MRKKMTADDVIKLNVYINSKDERIAKKAREKLDDCLRYPDCFADRSAADWAKKIYQRINKEAQ